MERKKTTSWSKEKEELYDVIAALADKITLLTNEIVELQGILLHVKQKRSREPGQTQLGQVW
tara:strand:- start:850 stop:1035 length:186 start_codon:yes stop_codon:yes gene_type:complete